LLGDLAGDEAEVVARHQQQEQGDRQSDPHRERLDGPFGLPAVVHEEEQCRAEAREYRDEDQDDDDFHAGGNRLRRVYSNPSAAMSSGIRIAGRAFRPGWIPSLAAAGFVALFIALGNWQTRRAEEKLEAGRLADEAARGPVLQGPAGCADPTRVERRPVPARRALLAPRTFLLRHHGPLRA